MPISKDPLSPATLPSLDFILTGDVTGSTSFEIGDTSVSIPTVLAGAIGDRLTTAEANITSLFTTWIPNYANAAAVQSATIGSTMPYIRIGCAGSGQKFLFQRVTGVQTLGRFQSADGQYWEPAGDMISTWHGCVLAEALSLLPRIGMGRAAFAAYKLDIPFSVEHDEEVIMSFNMDTEAFNEDGDEDEYNDRVAAAYRTTTDRTFFDSEWTPGATEGYKAHMARAHGLFKVADWFGKCPRTGIGTFFVQPNNGAHYVFGVKKLQGYNAYFRIKGKNLTATTDALGAFDVAELAFSAHPDLGANYAICTARMTRSVQSAGMTVVPDMAIVIRQCVSTAAAGTDDARLVNGTFCIESISTDVLTDDTITFTVYNPFGTGFTSPATLDTGPGAIDDPHGSSVIYGCQFLITGGFNDREDEAFFTGIDGAEIFEEQIAWVDATDQRVPIYDVSDTITTPGVDPERKSRYTGLQSRYRGQSVAFCGFDGRVIRISKGGKMALNLCGIGGIGKFKEGLFAEAERGVSAQLASDVEGIRTVVGNVRSFGVSSSLGSRFIWENCVITGALITARGITGGLIDLSASEIAHSPTGALMDGNSTLAVNTQTKFVSCTTGIDLRGDANFGGGIPQFEDCGTNIIGRKPARIARTTLSGPLTAIDMTWTAANTQGWRDIVVDVRNIVSSTGLPILELLVQIDGVWITSASYSWRYTDFATDSASSVATRMAAGGTPETESEVIHSVGAVAGDLAALTFTVRDFNRGTNPVVIEHEGYAVDTGTRARHVRGITYVEGAAGVVTGLRLQVKGGAATIGAGAVYEINGK